MVKVEHKRKAKSLDKKTTDGLVNVLTKAAAQRRDVTLTTSNFYADDFMISPAQCENIYTSSWIGKKIVEIPRDYIFKNGFTLKIPGNETLEKDVLKLYDERDMEAKIKFNEFNKRIYGGSVMFIKNPHQDPLKEFDPTACSIAPENIEFVSMDYSYLAIFPNTDMISENYFEPERISLAGLTAEKSNCIIFKGVRVPRRRMPKYRYLGMSVFQNIFQAMILDDYISKGIANMVWRNNRWYYKVDGLNELVKTGNESLALTRLSMVEDSMNVLSAAILDKNDEAMLISQSFTALPDVDRRAVERLSAACNIPATVLLGKSPDGQNSTGESDLENFYNWIEAQQKEIEPQMRQIFNILICMKAGKEVPFEFEFNKPNQISTTKQVEIDDKVLNNATRMDTLGLPEEVITDYLKKYGIITSEQAQKVENYLEEANEAAAEMQENMISGDNEEPSKEDK